MRLTVETDVPVPMDDGVVLRADVHRRDGREPLPALVQRVPYGRAGARTANFALDIRRAVEAGYAVVVQDVRGRFASGGAFTPFLAEADDGARTVQWAAEQPWCDGRVGMAGGSYAGAAQWLTARRRPPALRAIAPFVATPYPYDGWIYRDGVFELGFNLQWALRNVAAGEAADATPADYARLPLTDQPGAPPFYAEWLGEPVPTGRWGALAGDGAPSAEVPVLSIGGWFDVFRRGSLAGHATTAAPRRLVMGPWAHGVFGGGFPERSFGAAGDSGVADVTGEQLRWFDRWVKDEGGASGGVRVFVTGADVWREEREWPPADAAGTTLHLRAGGRLGEPAAGEEPPDAYEYDPATPAPTVGGATFLPGLHVAANAGPRDQHAVQRRPDVLCYTGEPLERALELAGDVRARLFVSTTAADADFAVTLCDVWPDGRALGVTDGIVRARYRESRTRPEPLRRGQVHELDVALDAVAHAFLPGHRLRLAITGGSFPRFDRNPQTGAEPAEAAATAAAVHWIHHDAAHPSRLVLSCVERDDTRAIVETRRTP